MPPSIDSQFNDLLDELVSECRKVLAIEGTAAESSLYGPFETFLRESVELMAPTSAGWVFAGQAQSESVGIPDFRVQSGTTLKGWVELKAVIGKDLGNLTGHDKRQRERFVAGLDNLIYSTGWQWRLYRHGQQIGRDVVLGPSSMFDPNGLPYAETTQPARSCVNSSRTSPDRPVSHTLAPRTRSARWPSGLRPSSLR